MNLPDFPSRPLLSNCWMTDIPVIEALTFAELSLPGAHNAGADSKAVFGLPVYKNWVACQSDASYFQLNAGARALDLRLEYEKVSGGYGQFWFQHNGYRSSRTLEELIMKVILFLEENPDEFILLDFHQLNAANVPFPYPEFAASRECWWQPSVTTGSIRPISAPRSSISGAVSPRPVSANCTLTSPM
jgi:1-phosphatidylinositol phosphodiesterase